MILLLRINYAIQRHFNYSSYKPKDSEKLLYHTVYVTTNNVVKLLLIIC